MRAHHTSIDPPPTQRVAPTADPLGKPGEASSRRPHIARSLIALMMVTTLCTPAFAQWKWLDANGNAQYSDRPPPPGIPESKVLLRPNAAARSNAAPAPTASSAGSTSAASAPALKTTDPELEARRKKAEADAKQEAAAKAQVEAERVAKAKADNCARAKSQAATLNDGVRIARVNEKGEREYLDDAQRAQEASRAQSIIATDCR